METTTIILFLLMLLTIYLIFKFGAITGTQELNRIIILTRIEAIHEKLNEIMKKIEIEDKIKEIDKREINVAKVKLERFNIIVSDDGFMRHKGLSEEEARRIYKKIEGDK